jgi:hypothetical protein
MYTFLKECGEFSLGEKEKGEMTVLGMDGFVSCSRFFSLFLFFSLRRIRDLDGVCTRVRSEGMRK